MWIFHLREDGEIYVVGFFQPNNGGFWTIGKTTARSRAAAWVSYLNGGSKPEYPLDEWYDGLIDLAEDHVSDE
jgi:hypothetical protein